MGKTINRILRLSCTGLVAGTLLLAGAGSAIADPPLRDNRSDHSDRGASRDRGDKGHQQDYRKREVHQKHRDNYSDRGERKDRRES